MSTKEIAALCFLSVFLLVHHHRFVLAGVVAAICASVWQMTAPLFILVLLLAIYHREWRAAGSMCVIAGFLALLVILPFYLVDAHTAMVSQVIWPLFGAPTRFRFLEIFSVIGKANYIVLFAILGYVSTIFAEFEDTTTVRFTAIATGIMWLIGTGSDNLDGADFVLFVPLLAVGIGYLVGYSAPTGSIASRMSPPALFIGLLVGAAVLWTIPPLGDFFSEMPSQARLELYFQATPPETCYRGTNYGEEFLKAVPDTNQRTCWQPSAQELWQWTYRRIIT